MDEIADWLNRLGMSEYAERFADNDVDFAALPHLTDADLKELGVSLGRRRKMLAVIAKLATRRLLQRPFLHVLRSHQRHRPPHRRWKPPASAGT